MRHRVLLLSLFAMLLTGFVSGAFAAPSTEKDNKPHVPQLDRSKSGHTTPIENELNRALRNSLDRARRKAVHRDYRSKRNTRISVTHTLSAPVDASGEADRGQIFKQLRQSLYSQINGECAALSEAFSGSHCHLSNLTVRPATGSRYPANEVHLTATATYILEVEIPR